MPDSATVRRINMDRIRQIMRSGEEFSKHQIAAMTGLSIATCNTLLNELEKLGEIAGEKKRMNEVGRSTVVYHMREEYESFLCILLRPFKNKGLIEEETAESCKMIYQILSPTKKVLAQDELIVRATEEGLLASIEEILANYPNIRRIALGLKGIISKGCIIECEIGSLRGIALSKFLSEKLGFPCEIGSDLSFILRKSYKEGLQTEKALSVVSIIEFQEKALPACATIQEGLVIEGSRGFAGSLAYLPFGFSQDSMKLFFKKTTFMPLAIKMTTALMAMMNPAKLLISGNLINEKHFHLLKRLSCEVLPEHLQPEFEIVADSQTACFDGMFERILELKEEENSL